MKAKDGGSTKAGCREPDVALLSARRVECSSYSSSPGETGARETYSSENIPVAITELSRPTT